MLKSYPLPGMSDLLLGKALSFFRVHMRRHKNKAEFGKWEKTELPLMRAEPLKDCRSSQSALYAKVKSLVSVNNTEFLKWTPPANGGA